MSEFVMKLPDVGEGVAEAEIIEWHVAVGDVITEDDVIADVMSDKATIELPSPVSGVVRWVACDVGDVLAVGATLIRIDTDDAGAEPSDAGASSGSASGPSTALPPPPAVDPNPADERPMSATPTQKPGPTSAAPAVRARALDLGLDLHGITGTGPDGRVTHADLDALLRDSWRPATRSADVAQTDVVDDIRVTGLRRNIAERMQASVRRIPHFTYVDEIDVTEVDRLRSELNAGRSENQPKLSMLPFLIRAVVLAVRSHPEMNARFDDDAGVVHRHRSVHLGIAVQTDRGLMVSVVQRAGALDLWDSATEVGRLAESARSGAIKLEELTGSTITISSLGALGGIVSTPVINAPEVAIIGVNKIADRPVFVGDTILRRKIMNLSSSFDHRVIDGADAAAFIATIRRLIETPAMLFVDQG